MTKYLIANTSSGAELGTYEGETPADALEACMRDAGYDSVADMERQLGTALDPDIVVTEIT